jgi:hypothetical protein
VIDINPEIDIFPSAIISYSFNKGNGGDIRVNFLSVSALGELIVN